MYNVDKFFFAKRKCNTIQFLKSSLVYLKRQELVFMWDIQEVFILLLVRNWLGRSAASLLT